MPTHLQFLFFFFNDTATTEIYTLSLHDALPIYPKTGANTSRDPPITYLFESRRSVFPPEVVIHGNADYVQDRKSTRLNSSHSQISYAVFCLKKKKNTKIPSYTNSKKKHSTRI